METSTALILIAGMAAVTYLTRLPLRLFVTRRFRLPALVDRILQQIPIAAFAAIVFPGVLQPGGRTDLHASNLYLYAAAATVIAAITLRASVLVTIFVGVATAALLQLVL